MAFIPEEHYLWDFWLVSPREWGESHSTSTYHMYYLQAPRTLSNPNLRHGVATVGHALSHDLQEWVYQGTALQAGSPGSWDDRAIWTGSVIVRDGVAYMFYTGINQVERRPIQRIGLAVSTDLIHWERHPDNPLLEVDTRWYETQNEALPEIETWRDPYVVYDPDERLYYMFLAARVNTGPFDGRGVIGLARSTNLLSWEVLPPVSTPGDFTEMEVPQVVALNGRYYLLFCATRHAARRLTHSEDTIGTRGTENARETADAVGTETTGWVGTHYLVADKLTGPYRSLTDEPLVADAPGTYYAGKLVCDSKGALFFIAWRQWDDEGNFCGGLSHAAPVQVLSDGRLQVDAQQLWPFQYG